MSKEIQTAISELNNTVDSFIKTNMQEIKEIKNKMIKKEVNTLPLSNDVNQEMHHKSEFDEYLRKGTENLLQKSLNENTGKEGGYFLPSTIINQIYDRMNFLSPIRSISKVITISSNSIDILVDTKNPDVGWGSSDGEREETASPEIKKIKIPVHEIYAKPKVSQHLLDDSKINVEEWLINKISEKFATLEDSAFIDGDGTDKPKGFIQYESEAAEERAFGKLQHFCSGKNGGFTDDEQAVNTLVDITCSLKPMYIKNAKWVMSRTAFAEIRKLKNKNGISLWQPSLSEAVPSTLLGYPVIIDDNMPALKDGTESISVAFGDFNSGYQIVDRHGFNVLRDPYTSKPFVEFYATKRIGGNVIDFDAIKLLKFKTAD